MKQANYKYYSNFSFLYERVKNPEQVPFPQPVKLAQDLERMLVKKFQDPHQTRKHDEDPKLALTQMVEEDVLIYTSIELNINGLQDT
eukprot:403347586